jgi:hypothetical protein
MPSICLVYGFAVALPRRAHSRFECLPPADRQPDVYYEARRRLEAPPGVPKLSPVTLRRVSGEAPMTLPGCHNRFGLCN